jgi:hypothetical protein
MAELKKGDTIIFTEPVWSQYVVPDRTVGSGIGPSPACWVNVGSLAASSR